MRLQQAVLLNGIKVKCEGLEVVGFGMTQWLKPGVLGSIPRRQLRFMSLRLENTEQVKYCSHIIWQWQMYVADITVTFMCPTLLDSGVIILNNWIEYYLLCDFRYPQQWAP